MIGEKGFVAGTAVARLHKRNYINNMANVEKCLMNCDTSCVTCQTRYDNCITCPSPKLLLEGVPINTCVTSCPVGYFILNSIQCVPSCP